MRNLLKTKQKILAQKVNKQKNLPIETNFIALHKMNFQRKQDKIKCSNEKLQDPKKQQLKGITYYFGCYSPAKSKKSQQCAYRQSFKGILGIKTKKTRTFTRVPRFFTTRSVDYGSFFPKQNQHPNVGKQNKTCLKLEESDLFAVSGIRKRINSEVYQQQDHQRSNHLGELLRRRKNSYFQRLDYQKKALKNKFFKDNNDFQQSNFQGKPKKCKQKQQLSMQSCDFKPWHNESEEQEITHFVRFN